MDLLILADSDGVVDMTPEAIARRTNRDVVTVCNALKQLEAPDDKSRTKDFEGRRIKRLDEHRDWGWVIVNYDKFREMATESQRREKTRLRVSRWRETVRKSSSGVTQCNANVTPLSASLSKDEKSAERRREPNGVQSVTPSVDPAILIKNLRDAVK